MKLKFGNGLWQSQAVADEREISGIVFDEKECEQPPEFLEAH